MNNASEHWLTAALPKNHTRALTKRLSLVVAFGFSLLAASPLLAAEKAYQSEKFGRGGLWASPDVSLVPKSDLIVLSETQTGDWTKVEIQNAGSEEICVTYNPGFKNLRMNDFYPVGSKFLKKGETAVFSTNTGQWFFFVYKAKNNYLRVPGNTSPEWSAIEIQSILAEQMARETFHIPISDAFQKQLDKIK